MHTPTNRSLRIQSHPKPEWLVVDDDFNAAIPKVTNKQFADQLETMAALLQQQKADFWRINAYRQGAESLLTLTDTAQQLFLEKGLEGLVALPDIGNGIAAAIVEILQTGHWSKLERLRGQLDPVWLFTQVPGIGAELAKRIVDQHNLDSLEGLESAAYDGRLARVKGIGLKRLKGIMASLSARLRPRTGQPTGQPPGSLQTGYPTAASTDHPSVDQLLSIDSEYRIKAEAGKLTLIAPKRFNPNLVAWLPILHTHRDDWRVTALYSNTDRAHVMRKTHD